MLNDITREAGRNRRRKRVGRGESSGLGKTSGRGNKGCQARAGGGTRPLHEGGQMPIFRRLPKRGFSNFHFRTEYQVVNVAALEQRFDDGAHVDLDALRRVRLVRARTGLLKVLGTGTLSKKLTVSAHAFSPKAKELIENAGGSAQLIERPSPQAQAAAKRNTRKTERLAKRAAGRKGGAPAAKSAAPAESPNPEAPA